MNVVFKERKSLFFLHIFFAWAEVALSLQTGNTKTIQNSSLFEKDIM